jgi:hypothetical protein
VQVKWRRTTDKLLPCKGIVIQNRDMHDVPPITPPGASAPHVQFGERTPAITPAQPLYTHTAVWIFVERYAAFGVSPTMLKPDVRHDAPPQTNRCAQYANR